jgi:hypothetical protein
MTALGRPGFEYALSMTTRSLSCDSKLSARGGTCGFLTDLALTLRPGAQAGLPVYNRHLASRPGWHRFRLLCLLVARRPAQLATA